MIRDSKKYILCRYDANTETEDYYSVLYSNNNIIKRKHTISIIDDYYEERGTNLKTLFGLGENYD
jgi:hypothetical protein